MPHPVPEQALRRLVSDLANLHADDIVAILGSLDAPQREAVEALLREHADYFEPPAGPAPPGFDAARFSPWLVQRLGAASGTMTDEARAALREAAARLYPASSATPTARAGLFRRRQAAS